MEDIDVDDFSAEINQTSFSDYDSDHGSAIETYWRSFARITYNTIRMANIAANLFLIFIILRFKRLRNRTNYYLMNIAITSAIYLALNHTLMFIFKYVPNANDYYVTTCYMFLIAEGGCFTMYLFASILAVDWYISNYEGTLIYLHDRLYRYTIAIVYFIGVTTCIVIALTRCAFYGTIYETLYVFYVILAIVVGIVNILRRRHSHKMELTKTKYALIAANVMIISWLPIFTYYRLLIIIDSDNIIRRILHETLIIPESIAHSSTMVLLYILGKVNMHFKKAFSKAFRMNVTDSESSELDNNSKGEAIVEHHVHDDAEPLQTDDAMKILEEQICKTR